MIQKLTQSYIIKSIISICQTNYYFIGGLHAKFQSSPQPNQSFLTIIVYAIRITVQKNCRFGGW